MNGIILDNPDDSRDVVQQRNREVAKLKRRLDGLKSQSMLQEALLAEYTANLSQTELEKNALQQKVTELGNWKKIDEAQIVGLQSIVQVAKIVVWMSKFLMTSSRFSSLRIDRKMN